MVRVESRYLSCDRRNIFREDASPSRGTTLGRFTRPRSEGPRAFRPSLHLDAVATYLITGGAGFIGSTLVCQLIAQNDHRVANVDFLTYSGNVESLGEAREHPRHALYRVDICDASALRAVFDREQPDAVFHLAAESHVDRSIDGPAAFIRSNVVGTFTMLQEALRFWRGQDAERRQAFRFVHVSTDEVYGSLGETGHFTETTAYAPNSPYS